MHAGFLGAAMFTFLLFRPFLAKGSLRKIVAAAIASAILSGCGWHLQGTAKLPSSVAVVQIETEDAYSDFYRELRASLLATGARVVTNGTLGEADAVRLHIKIDQAGQRLSSVSARNRPEQYEVFYTLEYSADWRGAEVIATNSLELTANYSYDTTAVLAKQREQMTLQQGLARELVHQVIRRIAALDLQDRVAALHSAQMSEQ